jgi:hypothetical protein
MRVEVDCVLLALEHATPRPWDLRGSHVCAPGVALEHSRMRGPYGAESYAFYGGELVAESCSRADARVIAAAGNLLPRLAGRYLEALGENDRLLERVHFLESVLAGVRGIS